MCNLYNVYIYSDHDEFDREPIVKYIGISYSEMTEKVIAAVELDMLIVIEKASSKQSADEEEE